MEMKASPHRERLWATGQSLACALVKDYVVNETHLEDAHQETLLALWEATGSWQEGVHSSFEHYAFYVMRGKLFRYLTEKAEDKPVLTRLERQSLKGLRDIVRAGQLVSCAVMAKLAEDTGLSLFRVQQIVAYWYNQHVAISANVFEAATEPMVQLEDYLLDTHESQSLDEALKKLDERERLIIAARFLEDPRQTLQQLATTLGISIERVHALETRSLKKLRKAMQHHQS
jgi:RNA polymerase sigma-32 factor